MLYALAIRESNLRHVPMKLMIAHILSSWNVKASNRNAAGAPCCTVTQGTMLPLRMKKCMVYIPSVGMIKIYTHDTIRFRADVTVRIGFRIAPNTQTRFKYGVCFYIIHKIPLLPQSTYRCKRSVIRTNRVKTKRSGGLSSRGNVYPFTRILTVLLSA
jgi:hypothetical protein